MTTHSPRIAFVSVHDPEDPHTWSGIPHAILMHLRRAGANVEVIGPLNRNARLLVFPAWITSKITRRAYHPEREPRVSAAYAKQIERRMSGHHFDAILSTETFVISRVDRPEPITYWTDGVWDLMANYYYMRPTKGFYARAKLHEQQAMAKAAHAVYSSEWAAAGAKKYYQAADAKLAVIPFGANLEIVHGRDFIVSAITARRRDSCVLLFLGVDWERKGGKIALETARLLNRQGLKTELIVAGCSVPGEKPDFVKEVGFLSKRSPEGRGRLADLLKSSHFLVLPTRAECAGVVLAKLLLSDCRSSPATRVASPPMCAKPSMAFGFHCPPARTCMPSISIVCSMIEPATRQWRLRLGESMSNDSIGNAQYRLCFHCFLSPDKFFETSADHAS
jgi:glycosyltransferase involved in cell wall biosynthesis